MRNTVLWVCLPLLIAACGNPAQDAAPPPPWVKTQRVAVGQVLELALTGTVRAHVETPAAFRVGGQILRREVDAGQAVRPGTVLFRLDVRDAEQGVIAARAERQAADAALAVATADTARHRALFAQGFIARQLLDRIVLAEREAKTRREAADARLQQARNASSYAVLRATDAGVVTEVTGEPGQVVAPGQPVATIAREGAREVEVFFPDAVKAPASGQLRLADGSVRALVLREAAAAAEPLSRTWRARYRVAEGGSDLALGSVVSARFAVPQLTAETLDVPLGALDERGKGAQVWHVVKGRAQPLPAQIVLIGPETARLRAALPAGTRLIVLGTHLLKPGMPVRELPQ